MLTKWLLKNGFGSPGQTAKTHCERFNHYYQQCSGNILEMMQYVYFERILAANKFGNPSACFDIILPDELLKQVGNDIPFFIYVVSFLETSNFRNGVSTQPELFNTTIEIIYETVQKRCPYGISKSYSELIANAASFTSKTYYLIHTLLKK